MTYAATPSGTRAATFAAAIRRVFTRRPGPIGTAALPHPATDETSVARHVVQPGETAASIAAAYGLCAASLLVRNGMRLREEPVPGRVLDVSRGEGGCREARPHDAPELEHHIVQPGEDLEQLCARFGVAPRILLAANGLATAHSVTPGIELVIPTSSDPRDTGEVPTIAAPPTGVSRDACAPSPLPCNP